MTLQQYSEKLLTLFANHPEAADFIVVTSKDDEGNGFDTVDFEPSIGHYDAGEWYTENDSEEHDFKVNAVCLN